MPADAYVMDADMKKVADAIRTKGGTTAPLTFPDGMVQAVNDIQAGGGHEAEDGLISGQISGKYTNDRVTSIRRYAFHYCKKLTAADFPNATSIGESAFAYCNSLVTADFPNATSIDWSAFYYCEKLTAADFPNATSIGMRAFYNCNSLVTADFPNATSIEVRAFHACKKLTAADFPNATSIGEGAFYYCNSLVTADFPNATSIGESAFEYCNSLVAVKLGANKVATGGVNMFIGADKAQIYVPDNLVDQYKVATNWSQYANRICPLSELNPKKWTMDDFEESAGRARAVMSRTFKIKPGRRAYFRVGDSMEIALNDSMVTFESTPIPGISISSSGTISGTITGGSELTDVMSFYTSYDIIRFRSPDGNPIPIKKA